MLKLCRSNFSFRGVYDPYEIGFINYVFSLQDLQHYRLSSCQNSKSRTQAQLPIGNQSTAEEQLIYCDFINYVIIFIHIYCSIAR